MTETRPTRRSTKQRAAVEEILADATEFRSAQDLHQALGNAGYAVGLATVYRTLQTLAEDGAIDVLRTEEGEALYRQCSSGHHHHLMCRSCGRTVEVEGQGVEAWAAATTSAHGFHQPQHTIELSGICGPCWRDGQR